MAPGVKNPAANAGDIRDAGSILGLGRSEEGQELKLDIGRIQSCKKLSLVSKCLQYSFGEKQVNEWFQQ